MENKKMCQHAVNDKYIEVLKYMINVNLNGVNIIIITSFECDDLELMEMTRPYRQRLNKYNFCEKRTCRNI